MDLCYFSIGAKKEMVCPTHESLGEMTYPQTHTHRKIAPAPRETECHCHHETPSHTAFLGLSLKVASFVT